MTDSRLARGGLAAACVALALCAATAAPGVAAETEIVRLDASRAAPVVLEGGAHPAIVRMPFELPAGATQGPDRWYLVRLHYRLRFGADSGRGFAWVTSDTNGRTAAQIEYTTQRRGGRLRVRRTTVDLIHGQRERRSRSARDTLTFTNYLQYQGVVPGANTWTISLEQAGGARVQHMEILGDSAIVETRRSPFPLMLTAAVIGDAPRVGERFTVKATLTARRGQPVGDVVVRARPPRGRGVTVLGPTTRRIRQVDDRRRTATFSFYARRRGVHAVTLTADSNANHPNASVQIEVLDAAKQATTAPAAAWALALAPALALTAWLVVARRRRQAR